MLDLLAPYKKALAAGLAAFVAFIVEAFFDAGGISGEDVMAAVGAAVATATAVYAAPKNKPKGRANVARTRKPGKHRAED